MSRDFSAERAAALRETLVALVETPAVARRPSRLFIASVLSFVIAGGVVGGVISTAAYARSTPAFPDVSKSLAYIGALEAGGKQRLLGEPLSLVGKSDKTVRVPVPVGSSNSVIVVLQCSAPGPINVDIDGQFTPQTCTDNVSGPLSFPVLAPLRGSGRTRTIHVSSPGTPYAIWISSVKPVQESTEQKAAMADGTVTRAEYLAAFHRLQGCMTAAGYDMGQAIETSTVIGYTVPDVDDDYFEAKCYPLEFEDVDSTWQVAHESK